MQGHGKFFKFSVIVATAIITENLTTISLNLVQAFAFEIEELEVDFGVMDRLASSSEDTEENTKGNTCGKVPALTNNNSFVPIKTPNPEKVNIRIFGSTILRPGRKIGRLNIKNNEESEEIESVQQEISKIVKKLYGIQYINEDKLKQIADEITKLYLYSGYITSKTQKPHLIYNDATDKTIINIYIAEGYLSEIIINKVNKVNKVNNDDNKQKENNSKIRNRVSNSYICSRILQAVDPPINITKLEEQLQLMNRNPLFESVEAELEPVGKLDETAAQECETIIYKNKDDLDEKKSTEQCEGLSKLTVNVVEANPFSISLSADNYSPPSIGSERLGINFRYLNLLRIEDEIAGSYLRTTTGGAELFDFSYKIPLNAKNGTLLFRAAPNNNEITQSPFDELGIRGEKEVYEFTYRQPLVRKLREEFALSLGFSFQEGQTFVFDRSTPFGIGPDEDGFSRTSTIQFTQDYTSVDSGGIWSLRSQFNFGTGLFDATTNDAPIPDGHFFSWFAQVQRGQRLSQNHLLVIQADLQLTPNSLLPAQQFVMGGGQSVRGYRQNVRSGDNGFRFSIEDRITVLPNNKGEPAIQIAPFIDLGVVWNEPDNPNELLDEQFLLGMGLGLQWKDVVGIKGLNLRFDYGIPLIKLDDRGNNIQDDGLYFQVNYQP